MTGHELHVRRCAALAEGAQAGRRDREVTIENYTQNPFIGCTDEDRMLAELWQDGWYMAMSDTLVAR